MKNIEYYADYREYLKDFYKETKARHHFFSYRYFARKAGLKSSALYQEVVTGKRNLTDDTLPAFIKGLGLGEKEGRFFNALVRFNQARIAGEKNKYLEEMRNLLPRLSEKTVAVNFYAYYSKWYNIALRELACAFDWKEDYDLLARKVQPAIKKREAREAIRLLLELGFLKKEKNGEYRQSDPHISTGQEVVSTSIRNVNRQFAQLGMESIEAIPPTLRDVSSLTLGISSENYQVLKQEILGFKDRVKQIVANQKQMNAVYNLNIQLFPLSKELQS